MTDLGLHLGRIGHANQELGAHVAYRALVDLLERHGQHEAVELLACHGEDVIRYAFSHESWAAEKIPTAGSADDTKSKDTKSTGGSDAD